jgi:hypothetical protein
MSGPASTSWASFWFLPTPIRSLRFVRSALCVVTAVYFLSAWGDVETWFQRGAPASSSNLATFFRTAELTSDARWMVSPLFMWDALFASSSLGQSAFVYRLYLLVGILLAVAVGVSDQGDRLKVPRFLDRLLGSCWPSVLLWAWFVGWANRIVLLAGIVEPLLSVSLAALAIAPIGRHADGTATIGPFSWRTTLAKRLLAVQMSLIAMMTTATMLASSVWWNGTGAYALVAPTEDRWFDVRGSIFETPWVYELTTTWIVCTLPIGILLAWRSSTRPIGLGLILVWCCLVALLSENVLFAVTLAITATAIGTGHGDHTPAGVFGAETLDGGSAEASH